VEQIGAHADPDGDRGPHRRDLLEDLEVDLVGLAAAAVLLGIGQPQQTRPAQHPEHLSWEGPGGLRLLYRAGSLDAFVPARRTRRPDRPAFDPDAR